MAGPPIRIGETLRLTGSTDEPLRDPAGMFIGEFDRRNGEIAGVRFDWSFLTDDEVLPGLDTLLLAAAFALRELPTPDLDGVTPPCRALRG